MSRKFKVGDKVRCIKSPGAAKVGATGTVGPRGYYEGNYGGMYFDLIWDNTILSNGQMNGGYCDKDFELLTPADAFGRYILVLEEGGKFYPAKHPREYATLKQAETVAVSMAEKHGGTFYVFRVVSKALPPVRPKAEVVRL